jgi:hypothetical protein
MGKRPCLVGAARSERDVVRRVSRRRALDVGRRSWSIAVAGEEDDEVRACGYVGREAKAMRGGERGGKVGRVGAR